MAAISASQSPAIDSTKVLSTDLRSKVERLMTLSTSAVAVCCCSDCLSSFNSRVFSMAMTAWLAKFETSATCLSVNGRTSWRSRGQEQKQPGSPDQPNGSCRVRNCHRYQCGRLTSPPAAHPYRQ